TVSSDDIRIFGVEIDNLALAFVAPLGTNGYQRWHRLSRSAFRGHAPCRSSARQTSRELTRLFGRALRPRPKSSTPTRFARARFARRDRRSAATRTPNAHIFRCLLETRVPT